MKPSFPLIYMLPSILTYVNSKPLIITILCEMHHARQSPRPVLIKSLQKSSFIGGISQYFYAREVCDWSVLTKLSLRMGLVPKLAQIPYIGTF